VVISSAQGRLRLLMADTSMTTKHDKIEDRSNISNDTVPCHPPNKKPIGLTTKKTSSKAGNKAKYQDGPEFKKPMDNHDCPKPPLDRAISKIVKDKNDNKAPRAKARVHGCKPSVSRRPPRISCLSQDEKATVSHVVSIILSVRLGQADFEPDGRAIPEMDPCPGNLLRSPLPSHRSSKPFPHDSISDRPADYITQIVNHTGPYSCFAAPIIRQEDPFRFLDLPVHIRAKVYNFALKNSSSISIVIVMKPGSRKVKSPNYFGPYLLALLRTCKQIHIEATTIVYQHEFVFPGTQVAREFLLAIRRNRSLLYSLRSEAYTSTSARPFFQLLTEARQLERSSFAHVSSNTTPKRAVRDIWRDAGRWLRGIDGDDPEKGLDVLTFDDQAFHIREKVKKTGGFRVTCWGPNEQVCSLLGLVMGVLTRGQLGFLEGLRTKMISEGRKIETVD
jgi:hypothetical protein